MGGRSNDSIRNGYAAPTSEGRVFSFAELKVATRSFRSDTILCEGSSGRVFKGCLDEKGSSQSKRMTPTAIKKLNPESMQGFKEWKNTFLGVWSMMWTRLFGFAPLILYFKVRDLSYDREHFSKELGEKSAFFCIIWFKTT